MAGLVPDVWVVATAAPDVSMSSAGYLRYDPFPNIAEVVSIHARKADAVAEMDTLNTRGWMYFVGMLVNWHGDMPHVGERLQVTTDVPGPIGLYPLAIIGHGLGGRPFVPERIYNNPGVRQNAAYGHGYVHFHGVEPDRVTEGKFWVPGELVKIGRGIDIGYNIVDRRSNKDGWYVHDFGRGVSIYRRARSGERPDKTLSRFPRDLMVLGSNLGFTYEDDAGRKHEVKGSLRKKLCVTPDKRTLVVVGPSGVEYVASGGRMRVVDWIYD